MNMLESGENANMDRIAKKEGGGVKNFENFGENIRNSEMRHYGSKKLIPRMEIDDVNLIWKKKIFAKLKPTPFPCDKNCKNVTNLNTWNFFMKKYAENQNQNLRSARQSVDNSRKLNRGFMNGPPSLGQYSKTDQLVYQQLNGGSERNKR